MSRVRPYVVCHGVSGRLMAGTPCCIDPDHALERLVARNCSQLVASAIYLSWDKQDTWILEPLRTGAVIPAASAFDA